MEAAILFSCYSKDDDDVYRIAKKLQLLNPTKFRNFFLCPGKFHLEKIETTCCGKYVKESDVNIFFVVHKIFGPEFGTATSY